MYKVKITELNKKTRKTKIYDFIGEFNEKVRRQWAGIAKHAPNMVFEFLANEADVKEDDNEK